MEFDRARKPESYSDHPEELVGRPINSDALGRVNGEVITFIHPDFQFSGKDFIVRGKNGQSFVPSVTEAKLLFLRF